MITVLGYSFNGNGLNAAIAFVTLKDFSERTEPNQSAQAIAAAAMPKLLFGLPDSMVFSIVPPAISSLGNASGFDMPLEARGGQGPAALTAANPHFQTWATKTP